MQKLLITLAMLLVSVNLQAQDDDDVFDPSQYSDASTVKKYCTQKTLNQTPTKLIGLGFEMNSGFKNSNSLHTQNIKAMGGLRAQANFLVISTNKLIISAGGTYWGTRLFSEKPVASNPDDMKQVYENNIYNLGANATAFKPLNEKHFVIVQGNVESAFIPDEGQIDNISRSVFYYGSAFYGWKKGDYRMMGVGLSRTYRLGRPLIVPVFLYNRTFNEKWGIEAVLPARGHVRYNFSTNSMLLGGYELEGQQVDLVNSNTFLQRGEIKPRLVFEQRLKGFFWLSLQAGYRVNGRFNLVDRYNGEEKNEIIKNNWGASPYVNISINFVSP
ncbi:MAG: hypothetical protein FGM54_11505 [Chitinophagaceae bacterium]|nr:hypothetical protein [Chitinophagaceae bacterium]